MNLLVCIWVGKKNSKMSAGWMKKVEEGNVNRRGQEGQRCGVRVRWVAWAKVGTGREGKEMQLTWSHPSSERTETQKNPGSPTIRIIIPKLRHLLRILHLFPR